MLIQRYHVIGVVLLANCNLYCNDVQFSLKNKLLSVRYSCSYQIVAYAVNNEGFLWDPPRVPTYYNFAWVPHTFGGSDPLLTPLISHTDNPM